MPEIALVVFLPPHRPDALPAFLEALAAQRAVLPHVTLYWAMPGAGAPQRDAVSDFHRRHDLRPPARAASEDGDRFDAAGATWVALCDAGRPLSSGHLERLCDAARACPPAVAVAAAWPARGDGAPLPPWHRCLLRREALAGDGGVDMAQLALPAADWALDALVWWALLRRGGAVHCDGGPAGEGGHGAAHAPEPPVAFWRDRASYGPVLRQFFAAPLQVAAAAGAAPRWLQAAVLERLHWYFTVDARERAPTVIVDETMAEAFHREVEGVMRHIEPEALAALHEGVATEVRHALWSYRGHRLHTAPAIDACDHEQRLLRVTWWEHGDPPGERFSVDGHERAPAYAKRRACNYFRRRLLRQRIAWLAPGDGANLAVKLDGRPVALQVGAQAFAWTPPPAVAPADAAVAVAALWPRFARGKGGQQPLPPGLAGWKVRLVKALARLWLVRWRYRRAWVFIDREETADDNAEHLYRWLRRHHPEVNAWFLLQPSSPDWNRLHAEGFRLIPPGWRRKLLILNAEHIVSTQTDYVFGGFDRRLYGDAMHWRYSFLQHGVIFNDLTHWLGPLEFDLFVTSSPAEHASIIGDDSGYPYTEKEVRRTGLPRHDRLLRIARELPPEEVNLLLVMPTWRGSLADERFAAGSPQARREAFAASEYATRWRTVLAHPVLRAAVRAAGLRLAFMPHPNVEPYLDAFGVDGDLEIVTKATTDVQRAFARTAVFVTDYTSAAFEMALLRRPVFYYQFDREAFYGGGHNWRPGYFDYERDGFGPVALDEATLLDLLRAHFQRQIPASTVPAPYLERMRQAMPDRDEEACRRTFGTIVSMRRRHPAC